MELKGAVAVITGSARGIGRVIAKSFANQGARVGLADILPDALGRAASEIEDGGGTALAVPTDITDPQQVSAMVERVEDELGPIDVLINNAATFSTIGPVWKADPEAWFQDIRVNLFGSFLCSRSVVRGMVLRKRGYVINVVSSGGVGDPHPYSTSYASSKTGLMRLTEGLALECQDHGVKVFALAPPAVKTQMTEFIRNSPGGKKWRPNFRNIFENGNDLPAELIAEKALQLVSGKADALSGRYFLARAEFDEIFQRSEEIIERDLLTLRIRT